MKNIGWICDVVWGPRIDFDGPAVKWIFLAVGIVVGATIVALIAMHKNKKKK